MSSISFEFDNVYLLFLIIPLVLIFTVPLIVIFAVKKDNRNGHSIASICIHVVMAILISFTAAGTKIIRTVTETNVYVVADVSYSADKNLDRVDDYINNIKMPSNSKKGVICFGKNYKLITRLGEKFSTVKGAGVDASETDIVNALNYAGTLFRDGVIKRIVLITDGKQTYESDPNELKRTVDSLAAKDIHVDAIFLDDNITSDTREVQISGAEYSPSVYRGRAESVAVSVQSSYDTDAAEQAIFSLYKNSERIAQRAEPLTAGMNTVVFDELDTSAAGTYEYTVTVQATHDDCEYNNGYSFTQTVSETLNVLLISDSPTDGNAVKEMYGENTEIDAYVNNHEVPCSVEALCKYDEIVITNADVGKVNNSAMFLQSLGTVVSLFGKSLITLGDTGIQRAEGGALNALGDMLPVNYGNSNQDGRIFTIVMDASRSMFKEGKLDRAKLAAAKLVDSLDDDDEVCVLAFHGGLEFTQTPPIKAVNRDRIKEKIYNVEVTQGTDISIGLEEALSYCIESDKAEKQVMLISDGLNYMGDSEGPLKIVKNMRANNIYTSVIDVGRGSADNNPADVNANNARELLQDIARQGSSIDNYWLAQTEEELENVILKEIDESMNEDVVEANSFVKVNRRRDEVLQGLTDSFESSYVRGFYNSKAKASANTVLTVEYQKPNGGSVTVPLYSYWNYGNGKVASFTSAVTGNWISVWQNAGGLYGKFFKNVLDTSIPQEKINYPFVIESATENGGTTVRITPAAIRADASAKISVTLPDGQKVEDGMPFDLSVYSYHFPSAATGKYVIDVTYTYAEKDYAAQYAFNISHLPEYDCFAVFEASGLHKAVGGNGTVVENGNLSIVNDDSEMGKYTTYLTVPLLIACVTLFAVDIIVRKIKWEDIKSLFGKGNK